MAAGTYTTRTGETVTVSHTAQGRTMIRYASGRVTIV